MFNMMNSKCAFWRWKFKRLDLKCLPQLLEMKTSISWRSFCSPGVVALYSAEEEERMS